MDHDKLFGQSGPEGMLSGWLILVVTFVTRGGGAGAC
jgi:hypothetical protein